MDNRSLPRAYPGWLSRLAPFSDSPRRTAAAFALGVFLSFSPFFGLQIFAGMGLSLVLRLNRVAIFAGLCTNLPWVMVPWYALTTALGAALLRVPLGADVGSRLRTLLDLPVYRAPFWDSAAELLRPFLWSFVVGSTLGALVVGAVAYVTVARVMARVHASGGP
jgi:uncharacterized protein (DUF2062 family)